VEAHTFGMHLPKSNIIQKGKIIKIYKVIYKLIVLQKHKPRQTKTKQQRNSTLGKESPLTAFKFVLVNKHLQVSAANFKTFNTLKVRQTQ